MVALVVALALAVAPIDTRPVLVDFTPLGTVDKNTEGFTVRLVVVAEGGERVNQAFQCDGPASPHNFLDCYRETLKSGDWDVANGLGPTLVIKGSPKGHSIRTWRSRSRGFP